MSRFWKVETSNLPQTTIGKPVSISGWALRYYSKKATVNFLPSVRQGLVFKIGDNYINASPENIIFDKNHCTHLRTDEGEVKETEHVLSAVYGLGITNLIIEIIGCDEPPIMDGSSKPFVDALTEVGVEKLSKNRDEIQITKKFKFSLPKSDSSIEVEPFNEFFLDLRVDFPKPIGKQRLFLSINPETYRREIAFARPPLRCPIENASAEKLREWFEGYDQNKNSIIYYSKEKYLTKLRVKDEVVRHKALDIIGDLANAGLPIRGRFSCYKAGHKINGEFAKLFSTQG